MLMNLLLGTGLSFLFLLLLYWPLEKAFPATKQSFFRAEWFTDLLFFLGQYLLFSWLLLRGLEFTTVWLDGWVPSSFREAVADQPFWLQIFEVIFLSDLLIYWAHRIQHAVPFLWRFHSIHHSAEHLDWLAAHREHPIDSVYTQLMINLPPIVLGFPLETLAGFAAFRGLWAIYIHSNVRMPTGPLRILLEAI